jgi:hypothetical protein
MLILNMGDQNAARSRRWCGWRCVLSDRAVATVRLALPMLPPELWPSKLVYLAGHSGSRNLLLHHPAFSFSVRQRMRGFEEKSDCVNTTKVKQNNFDVCSVVKSNAYAKRV